MDREQREIFEQYFRYQAGKAGALTPGQQLDLIRQLRERAQQGVFPLGPQTVGKLSPDDPLVKAVLSGEDVSVAGKKVAPKRQAAGSWRLAVVAAAMLLPMALVLFLLMARGRGRAQGPAPTGTPVGLPPAAATKAAATATAAATPATVAPAPTATAPLTASGAVSPAVAASSAFALGLDEAAAGANDPASLEIAGNTFALGAGKPQGGVWQPTGGGEWLEGTELRRVVAVPYSADLAATVGRLRAGDEVRLRLRSGEVVRYQVAEVARVRRHQIEVLAERRPSLVVVLYGERTGDRTVVVADAVQEAEGFAVYTPAPPPVPAAPTPVVSETQIITTSRVVTNAAAGLALEVGACNRVQRVGEQQPPKQSQQFLVCPVRLRALADGASYSGQALAVTEKAWFLGAVGWWPPTVALPTALGDGTLRAGAEVSGDVAGIVVKPALGRRSEPVLIWEQSGVQILIILE